VKEAVQKQGMLGWQFNTIGKTSRIGLEDEETKSCAFRGLGCNYHGWRWYANIRERCEMER
jgi:hypothetical protein